MDFPDLKCFLLIIGSSRSGSTLLGAIADAHPNAIVANETRASAVFWNGLDRTRILQEIVVNSEQNRIAGKPSEGYSYAIDGQSLAQKKNIFVAGDKVWNPATLLLHGDVTLLARLEKTFGVPVRIIHTIRNPFDVIATMHARSGAPIADRIPWYFMHCDAASAIRNRCNAAQFLDVHHEELIESPDMVIERLCTFLGLQATPEYIAACKKRLFTKPKATRAGVSWSEQNRESLVQRMSGYDFLARYSPAAIPT